MTMTLAEVPDATIAYSLNLRRERDPLAFFQPASKEQAEALKLSGKGALILGGNRSGKSQVGAVRTALKATGTELPEFPGLRFKRARLIWCVSQDLPGQAAKAGEPEEPHTQLEAIKNWMPREMLRGGSWATAYSPSAYVLTLANGTKLQFKSYDQGLLQFESAKVGHIWFDEEPTQPAIFTSCLLRLVDERGTWDMTLTPVLSLQGKTGIAESLWESREKGRLGESPYGQYDTIQLFTSRNVHLPVDEVKALERLPEEEKQVRLYGAFARLGGRVLSEFDPSKHLVNDFIPPRDWRHYLVIDPGWHVSDHRFFAVDRKGRVFNYAEHYARQEPIPERMRILHLLWQAFGKPEIDVIGDSAAFQRARQGGTDKVFPSDFDEYSAAASAVGADWFHPRPCQKGDPNAYRVKRYLAAGMWFVCRSCRMWLWEQERWTWKRERTGPSASEMPRPDEPSQANDHAMDTTRYMANELPDPVLDAPDWFPPSSIQAHWQTELAELDRGSGGQGEWYG